MNILDRHRRLKIIGNSLLQGDSISDEDREFLGIALIKIGDGTDARDELQTKPRQGEDNFKTTKKRNVRDKLLYGWLEAAMAPEEEDGLGLSRKDAIKLLKSTRAGQINFPIDAKTIDRYLRKYPEKRNRNFTLD